MVWSQQAALDRAGNCPVNVVLEFSDLNARGRTVLLKGLSSLSLSQCKQIFKGDADAWSLPCYLQLPLTTITMTPGYRFSPSLSRFHPLPHTQITRVPDNEETLCTDADGRLVVSKHKNTHHHLNYIDYIKKAIWKGTTVKLFSSRSHLNFRYQKPGCVESMSNSYVNRTLNYSPCSWTHLNRSPGPFDTAHINIWRRYEGLRGALIGWEECGPLQF